MALFHGNETSMKCIIIANGTLGYDSKTRGVLKKADLIIAADGGARHLKNMNIQPHAIIGDLDSIPWDTKVFFEKHQIPLLIHPSRKNNTYTDLCLDFALEKGATQIIFKGVTGKRLDHTLANIFLLRRLSDLGIEARIMDANNEIYLVTDKLEIQGKPGDYLSVIPVSGQVSGLFLRGVEFPLENASLSMGSSLGISNCFKDTTAFISITKGVLLVTKSRD